MDHNTTITCVNISSGIDARTYLIGLSILLSTILSIIFYSKNRSYGFENSLNERLFQIQKLAFDYPFVEDKKFISSWDEGAEGYRNGKLGIKDTEKILRYEQYCEMIFNLISDNYSYKSTEEYLQKNIDFKNWVRTHKNWWVNPLETHSNHDTHDDSLTKIIDGWIK